MEESFVKTSPRWVVERKAQGWSGAELARRAKLHPSTVTQAERGQIKLYPGQVAKIAAAFGWQADPAGMLEQVAS